MRRRRFDPSQRKDTPTHRGAHQILSWSCSVPETKDAKKKDAKMPERCGGRTTPEKHFFNQCASKSQTEYWTFVWLVQRPPRAYHCFIWSFLHEKILTLSPRRKQSPARNLPLQKYTCRNLLISSMINGHQLLDKSSTSSTSPYLDASVLDETANNPK